MPCFKLGIRFDRMDMVKLFLNSQRTGFYFRVICDGEVGAGDSIFRAHTEENALTIADIVSLYSTDSENLDLLR